MIYLNFYNRYAKSGRMPDEGLCMCFDDHKYLELFEPDENAIGYWGNGIDRNTLEYIKFDEQIFTELRQNIVLFMAAMAGEL